MSKTIEVIKVLSVLELNAEGVYIVHVQIAGGRGRTILIETCDINLVQELACNCGGFKV